MSRTGNARVIGQLPPSLQKLIALERFHLHKAELFQMTSRDPAFDTRYLPQNCDAFRLPCFWVVRENLYIYGHQQKLTNELDIFESQGSLSERVLYPIHPMFMPQCEQFLHDVCAKDSAEEGLCVWAVPTSSTRTLLAWPDQRPERALFIKTSLNSPIFGDRRLDRSAVAGSVGRSRLVQESRARLPETLEYFPESVGFVPRLMPNSGIVIRSIPEEIKEDNLVVAPLFSLLGGSEGRVPLFLTILDRSGMEPLEFLEDVLCARFARLWLALSMNFGLIVEAHGQDLMLALSQNLTPLGRFFYRDFEGLQVDWELRRLRGLSEPENMPNAWSWYETYATLGYRYTSLVWYKLMVSLHQYLHLVLNELNLSLCEWQKCGLIRGAKFGNDDVTMIFSQHIMKALDEMFGVNVGVKYNIYRSLSRFIILLMKVRAELALSKPPDSGERVKFPSPESIVEADQS